MDAKIQVGRTTSEHFQHDEYSGRECRVLNVELVNIVHNANGTVDVIGRTRRSTKFESAPKLVAFGAQLKKRKGKRKRKTI